MRNLHKLLIVLISVAFVASGVFAQTSYHPAPKFSDQSKQKVQPASPYNSYLSVEFTEKALQHKQSNEDLQIAGIVEAEVSTIEFSEDQLKKLNQLGFNESDLGTEEGIANAEKLLSENMVSTPSPLLSTFSSNAIKNPDETVTVTVGIETNVSAGTNDTPFGTYYEDGQNQYLFSASELAIAGIGAGEMTEIGWEVVTADPAVMLGFNIEVKHTDATTVTGFETDFTNVYSGDYTAVAGWNMFTFSSPFAYDGTQNLLVKVCFDNDGYTANSSVYYSNTVLEMNGWAYNDGTAGCSDPYEGSLLNRPNTRITGEESLGAPPSYPFDESPISGTFDVPIDGDLTWTFGNNTDTYDLWLGPVGAMELKVEGATATTGTYTYALDYAMGYEWQVVGHNGFGTTAGPVWNFVTACAVVTAPFYEDFTIWPPVCWDLTGGTYEWAHYTTGVECAEAGFWGQSAGNTDYMTSGTIDISGGNFGLEFYWSHLYSTNYPDDALEVLVSDDGGTTWTQVWYKVGTELESGDGAGNTAPGTFVSSDIISLGAFGDEIKLQFIGWSGYGPDLFVDDISVFDVAYGDLDGTIKELATNNPIEGAVVTIDGMTGITGGDGTYSITGVLVGDYDVTVTADGFNPTSTSVTILDGITTTQDFAMTTPTMDIDPLAINVTIDPNGQLTQNIDITNNGDGTLDWNAQIEQLDENSSKGSMTYGFDLNNDQVVSFDADVPGTFTNIGGTTLLPFAGDFDAANLDFWYAVDYNDGNLYTIEVATGAATLVGPVTGVTAGHNVSGMACDKSTGIMYVSSTDVTASDIYTLDLTTGALTLVGTTGIAGLIEIAIDGTSTMYGWGIVSDASFTIDINTGAGTELGPLGVDLNYAQGGNWDPATDLIYAASYSTSGQLMTLDKTTGAFVLVGEFQGGSEVDAMGFPGGGGPQWLTIDPNSGTIDAGNAGMMDVNFDATDLFAGTTKTANIHFYSTPDVGMVTVPVSMTVGNQEFGYIEGNVMLDGAAPYNMGDVEEVEVMAGAYMTNPDAEGDYMIEVYPGTYDVTTTLYGYETQSTEVVVAEGGTVSDVDFVMTTTYGRVMGTVTDAETGDPIANAMVMVIDTDFETMTAVDGTYEIFIEAGTYDVYANHDLYTPQTAVEVVVMAEMDTELDFELEFSLACEFSVVLTDDYGDGWNGNTLTISVDGVPVLENIGLATGSGPETFYFETATGSEVLCEYVGTAAQWDYENEYHIFDNDNEEVFADGVGGVPPVGGTFTSQCIVFIYGDLSGVVTELETGNPIEGAVIMVDDMEGVTIADGSYFIESVMVGTWDATCNAMGYNVEMETVEIFEELLTEQDFALTAPTIDVDPMSISVTLEPNEMADEMVTITNNGNGPLDWGAQVQFMDGGNSAKGSMAYGFDLNNDQVVSFDTDAPGTFTTIGGTSLLPFAGDFDNANTDHFYAVDYNDGNLYTVEVATGTATMVAAVTGVTSGHNVSGMACDKTTGVMYVSSTNVTASDIYTIDLETGALTLMGTTGIEGLIEIAIDGTGTMYGWDIVSDASYVIDKSVGTSTLLGALGVDLNYAQGGNWDPELDLIYAASYSTSGQLMTLDKTTGAFVLVGDFQGGSEVDAMGFMGGTASWLTIDPSSGMLDAGGDVQMTVHFDATGLLPGVYEAEIHFGSSPDVGSPVIIVTMTVEGLIPAVELVADYTCTDVELMWEMPTGGDPDSWDVYRDDELIGSADAMTYTDMLVMPEMEYTYTVVAVYGSEEAQPSSPAMITVPVPADLDPYDAEALTDDPNENGVTLIWEVPEACVAPDSYSVYKNGEMIADGITESEYYDPPMSAGVYEYYVIAVYYFGESDASNAAYAVITGIEDYDASLFQIYPNPAAEMVNVKSPVSIDRVLVLNSNGQLVLDEEVNSMEYQINVSKYDAGFYFIKLETSEGVILRKVAVK